MLTFITMFQMVTQTLTFMLDPVCLNRAKLKKVFEKVGWMESTMIKNIKNTLTLALEIY